MLAPSRTPEGALAALRQSFEAFVARFFSEGPLPYPLELKRQHSARVAALALRIAQDLEWQGWKRAAAEGGVATVRVRAYLIKTPSASSRPGESAEISCLRALQHVLSDPRMAAARSILPRRSPHHNRATTAWSCSGSAATARSTASIFLAIRAYSRPPVPASMAAAILNARG